MMKIILYSTGCPKCGVLKKKLLEKNIDYTENSSVNEMLELGIKEVPVLSVEGMLMHFKDAVDWVNNQ